MIKKHFLCASLCLLCLCAALHPAQAQKPDSLITLYHTFINAPEKERISIGRNIAQWMANEGLDVDSILFENTLTKKAFEIKVLYWTTGYLFHFGFMPTCIEAADELIQLAEVASDTASLWLAYYYKGFANQRLGKMDEGLLYAQKAYECCLALKLETGTSSVLNNMGNIYMVNGQDSMAIIYFGKSLEIERKLGRKPNQAIRLGNMAACYVKLNMLDKALTSALEGIELDLQSGRPDKLSIRYHQAGEVYHVMGDFKKAKEHELKALDYFEQTNDTYYQSIILNALGKLEMQQHNYSSALQYLNRALALAESIDNNLLIEEACDNLHQLHRESNPALSLKYLERFVALKDSIFHSENQQQINEFQVKYDTQQKEIEIFRQQSEIDKQKVRQQIFIGGLALAGLLLTMLVLIVVQRSRRNRQLAEINALKDKFFSIISHDLKNPAIALQDALQSLTDNAPHLDAHALSSYYLKLNRSANGLVSLLNNLLNWAQIQTGREIFHPSPFNIVAVLQPDLENIKSMAARKEITFETIMPLSAIITGDENMLLTVIRNLLSNAVKFTATGGTVTLEITPQTSHHKPHTAHLISVSDTGTGMSPQQLQNLFRIDRQGSMRGTAGETGTGLGLIVCKEMIEKHGSTLNVESEEGKGSRFWFTV